MGWTVFYTIVYATLLGLLINTFELTGADRVATIACATLVSMFLGAITSSIFHDFKEKVG